MNGITVGIFRAVATAMEAIDQLRRLGYTEDRITVLAPRASRSAVEEMWTAEAEQNGMASPLAAQGTALDSPSLADLLPADELYVYKDALARGRTVMLVSPEGHASEAWRTLEAAGAESVDAAREDWWTGIRDLEQLAKSEDGSIEPDDERSFRRGYEMATQLLSRGASEKELTALGQGEHPDLATERAFLRGYRRGLAAWERGRSPRKLLESPRAEEGSVQGALV